MVILAFFVKEKFVLRGSKQAACLEREKKKIRETI
jgi:hypothetical protein